MIPVHCKKYEEIIQKPQGIGLEEHFHHIEDNIWIFKLTIYGHILINLSSRWFGTRSLLDSPGFSYSVVFSPAWKCVNSPQTIFSGTAVPARILKLKTSQKTWKEARVMISCSRKACGPSRHGTTNMGCLPLHVPASWTGFRAGTRLQGL